MAALSCGYFLGGSLADRYPEGKLLFSMIFFAGLYTAVISFSYRGILLFCQGAGLISGSILATVLLFAIPMILLSTVSPFIIRLLAKEKQIGITAGKIYSISTVGSIFGTFLSSFFLIPRMGSHKTLVITLAILLLTGMAGLILHRKSFLFLFIFFLPVIFNYADPLPDKNTLLVRESPYSHIEVVKLGEWLCLKPQENFYHSLYHPKKIMTGNEWDYYCIAPLVLNNASNSLVLGMGGGTSVRQFMHFWPDLHIDALDIDPVMAEIATGMFEVPKDSPFLNIIIDDARTFLQNNKDKKYDFIEIDIFRGGVFIPFYLATEEFFKLSSENLSSRGMIIMNVNIPADWHKGYSRKATLFGSVGNTIEKVFPSLFYITLDSGNALFIAFKEKLEYEDLLKKLDHVDIQEKELKELVLHTKENLEEYERDENSYVLTDDFSPVDELTYPIAVVNFNRKD